MPHPCRERKGQSLLDRIDSYTVIDLETTGLDTRTSDIIELGAVRVENGEVTGTFSELVNPGYPLPPFITELTGITDEMLEDRPSIEILLPRYLCFLGGSIVIGHNVNFDVNFLYDKSMRYLDEPFSNDFIDTMRLSRLLFPEEEHHRLLDLVRRFRVPAPVSHRALADVLQTNAVYVCMKPYLTEEFLQDPKRCRRKKGEAK